MQTLRSLSFPCVMVTHLDNSIGDFIIPMSFAGPVCLIVEFARYGNLRDFLRQCEEVVLSLNHKPHIPRNR